MKLEKKKNIRQDFYASYVPLWLKNVQEAEVNNH